MYKAEEQRVREDKTRRDNEKNAFSNAVDEALNTALRPAFEEVASRYKENGLKAETGEGRPITCNGEKSTEAHVAGVKKSLISMRFQLIKGWLSPKDFRVPHMPDLGIVADKSKSRLVLFVTDLREPSPVAPREVASFDPTALTKEAVVDAIVETLTEANNIGRRP
ncbi:hypothetical protein [Sorangium sp. So ce887]|uniref:hypothetical protein n=1 Tax=Sorangium sp. So ce887 TaxID=3133324 RepID=UPI003F5EA52B